MPPRLLHVARDRQEERGLEAVLELTLVECPGTTKPSWGITGEPGKIVSIMTGRHPWADHNTPGESTDTLRFQKGDEGGLTRTPGIRERAQKGLSGNVQFLAVCRDRALDHGSHLFRPQGLARTHGRARGMAGEGRVGWAPSSRDLRERDRARAAQRDPQAAREVVGPAGQFRERSTQTAWLFRSRQIR